MALDTTSPSVRYSEAPAAALSPAFARREFPIVCPTADAILISPLLSLFQSYTGFAERSTSAIINMA